MSIDSMGPGFHAMFAWGPGFCRVADFHPHPPGGSRPLLKFSSLAQLWKALMDLHRQFPATVSSSNRTVTSPDASVHEPILPQIAAGEARAMNRCITQYGGIVWSIARRYIKDTAEAEDLVQEVFTEVWKKSASFNPAIASESTFIGLIARRRAIDFLRRSGRRPDFEPLSAAESLPQPVFQNHSVTCDPETVRASLANLPPDTRQLFHLFFEDGFTHPEIAEKTGLPLGTIKTRLRRGLITLRDQLQRLGTTNHQSAS
jgi:RNA polymerase sigma-70 factor (ECF subfamily)